MLYVCTESSKLNRIVNKFDIKLKPKRNKDHFKSLNVELWHLLFRQTLSHTLAPKPETFQIHISHIHIS